ncbi:hypothetical protein C5167_023080 [Papaver somniferum]|uniref:Uncharacterized protein n=1 Tax=Papaver somniferum TaxID=3469 RepID=A0A4Y7JMT8_PAPSO|nr:hypothetical protein C5167_023080 [Papaver somniferum]
MLMEKVGLSKPKNAKPPSAEHKHNSPASQPPKTLPKEKIPEATKKETPPRLVHQSSSQAGVLVVEAIVVEATAVPI